MQLSEDFMDSEKCVVLWSSVMAIFLESETQFCMHLMHTTKLIFRYDTKEVTTKNYEAAVQGWSQWQRVNRD